MTAEITLVFDKEGRPLLKKVKEERLISRAARNRQVAILAAALVCLLLTIAAKAEERSGYISPVLLAAATKAKAQLHPVVEVHTGYLLGAVANGKWTKHKAAAKALKGGEKYRIYGLTGRLGEATGSKTKSAGEACDGDLVAVELSLKPEDGVIALAAEWNALPRVPEIISGSEPIYVEAVRSFLEGRGLKNPEVKITQILRVDLDGNSEDEVLISATNNLTSDGHSSGEVLAGSYSFVLLRELAGGAVQTKLIAGEFRTEANAGSEDHFGPALEFEISAVLDINGDGKMEVIVSDTYYEGGGTTIYRCSAKKIEKLLHVWCGL